MIKIPEDIEKELIKNFPDSNVRGIIEAIFNSILNKALKDGSCNIREFGKFDVFKTISTKLGTEVLRMKFKISPALEKKIKFDQYLLNNAPVKAKVPFTEDHQKKCNPLIKIANAEAVAEASRLGNQKTKEKIMSNLVMEILNENDD